MLTSDQLEQVRQVAREEIAAALARACQLRAEIRRALDVATVASTADYLRQEPPPPGGASRDA